MLKVALTENDNARLKEEANALKKIHSEFVIAIYDTLEIAGRTVLVLQKAGEESLAIHLRKYGVPALDLLARYGEHLLSAVASLERHGVVHRDIKPDNIGIHSINKQQNQLILYDFSLTSAPLDNLFVGTADYRDPFLKNRKSRTPKWDLAASGTRLASRSTRCALATTSFQNGERTTAPIRPSRKMNWFSTLRSSSRASVKG